MRVLVLLMSCAAITAACGTPGRRDSAVGGKQFLPRWYRCQSVDRAPEIDGRLDDAAWQAVPWTEAFVDIEGAQRGAPRFGTRAKLCRDEEYLYIAADLEEPHVQGTLTQHDQIVFHDNDFELFIDPDGDRHRYYEIEINALGTIFDLLLEKTYIEGGPADHEWDLERLRCAVAIDGTLNDPSNEDQGWSVELALPWRSLAKETSQPCPPRAGDVWRVNFSRVEWRHEVAGGAYHKIPDTPEDNWVWSPQGAINMHLPHMWGYVEFR